MRKTIKATLALSSLVLLSSLMPPLPAQQSGTQAQSGVVAPPPPPPAYTPRAKDAPPVEDTPAQRVRDQVFSIAIGITGKGESAVWMADMKTRIAIAAEQVSGNLF